MIRKYAEIFCWKNVSSFCSAKATHIFSAKNIRILYIESAKTVNEMTLNKLVKLTTLWTTGPCLVYYCCRPIKVGCNFPQQYKIQLNNNSISNISGKLQPSWLKLFVHDNSASQKALMSKNSLWWLLKQTNYMPGILKHFKIQLRFQSPQLGCSILYGFFHWTDCKNKNFVCVEVLRPSQPNGVMSSAVSLPNHTFTEHA